jgi:hypothetical protein
VKKNTAGVWVICALSLALASCAKSPAKCSDEKTLAELTGQIIGQLDISQLDQIPLTSIKVIDTRATAFDENIKKLSCEGTLTMSNKLKLPIRYESQLNDDNKHIVTLKDFDVQSLFTPVSAARPALPPAIKPIHIVGEWAGQLGGDGSMTVTKSGAGYQAELGVNVPSDCAGTFTGQGQLNGSLLKLVDPVEKNSCVVTVNFDSGTAKVSENNCLYYHGASCDFNGTLKKTSSVPISTATIPVASTASDSTSSQVDQIEKLYAEFPADSIEPIQNLPASKLSKLFTSNLISLLSRDNKCAAESQSICNLDFSLQWDSQDPTGATAVVSQGASPTQVKVLVEGNGEPRELLYNMQQTPKGWRIADIQYPHGSLVNILKQ